MAKTYDVYIAKTTYELIYPTQGANRNYLHFDDVSEASLAYMKAIADLGDFAIAYVANEESVIGGDYDA